MINRRDIRRLKGVDSALAMIFYEVQRECPYEIHVGRFGGLRTEEDQNYLYRKGKSTKDGYRKRSKHQDGKAVDFVVYIGSNAIWDRDVYWEISNTFIDKASRIFNTRVRSGADWDMDGIRVDKDDDETFLDSGHIELI